MPSCRVAIRFSPLTFMFPAARRVPKRCSTRFCNCRKRSTAKRVPSSAPSTSIDVPGTQISRLARRSFSPLTNSLQSPLSSVLCRAVEMPTGQILADDFHIYAVEWEPEIALLPRFEQLRHLHEVTTASRRAVGIRSSVFHHPECRGGRRLARRSGCHYPFSSADAG